MHNELRQLNRFVFIIIYQLSFIIYHLGTAARRAAIIIYHLSFII